MTRSLLLPIVLAFACGSAEPMLAEADTTAPPAPTPAEEALAAHGSRLRASPGVVQVDVTDDRASLRLTVCAPEALARIDTADVDVPIITGYDADSETCGCVHNATYYAVGESYPVDCNSCRCGPRGHAVCTLLACEVKITQTVLFARASHTVDDAGLALVGELVQALADHPELAVRVVGHSAPGEARGLGLSQRRAEVVTRLLVAAGVDAGRLQTDGVGATQPLTPGAASQKDPRERRVSFDVIAH